MILRPYQSEAYDNTLKVFERVRSALIVMATGLGKTQIFSHLANTFRKRGRIMVIAHREELINQAKNSLDDVCDTNTDIEMGEFWASGNEFFKSEIVVSTIQSQIAGREGGRMTRFDPNDFSLLVIDEAHHSCADSYKKVIEYYKQNPNLRILGVTATPDRTDKLAMGQLFEEVSYEYGIADAIEDGWLVPIRQQSVYVNGLDYSSVRTTAGDLNGKDLSTILEYEANLHGIADPTVQLCGDKKTLVFAASVAQAERLAEIINRHKPESARFVCGTTPSQIRRDMFKEYAEGRFQYLVNVGIATEGWDGPDVQIVVMARPTKSRSLYTQMAGRGTRPLPGIVDAHEEISDRREAIEKSGKPFLTILDFVGNAGRHKLVNPADILGGKYSDEVIELAKENAQKKKIPTDIASELVQAEREIHHRRLMAEEATIRDKIKLRAKFSTASVNPFDVLDIEPERERSWHKGRLPSQGQLAYLQKCGINTDGLSFTSARQLIDSVIKRREENKCTFKQAKLLRKFGYSTEATFVEASKIIDAVAKNNWKRVAM